MLRREFDAMNLSESERERVRPHARLICHTLLLITALCTLVAAPCAAQESAPVPTPMWIWAEGTGKTPETIFFRRHFQLPPVFNSVRLAVTADDSYRVWMNDARKPICQGSDFTTVQEYDVTRYVRSGENLIAIECQNTGGPGGLLFRLTVRLPNGKSLTVTSNEEVRFNRRVPPDWTIEALDDSHWPRAVVIAPANGGVWGQLYSPMLVDPGRMVRLWDMRSSVKPGDNAYTAPRSVGDRMVLSTNTSSAAEMQLLAQCGFTLFQTDSEHLSTEEVQPGVWDFGVANGARQTVQRLGLDWCYYPHEAFPPAWYRKTVPFTRIQCLEDKLPVEAFSPWDNTWPPFIERGYAAMEKAFLPKPAPRANRPAAKPSPAQSPVLYVGIHGDYGECGFMMGSRVLVPGQKEDWQQRFGNLHDHLGWWCNDPNARANFTAAMLQKYGTLEALNAAWKRAFKTPEEIGYPGAPRSEARREWLDFTEWYYAGIGKAIDANLTAARNHFPDSLLMLPAGFADENPRGGNDNTMIPKLAAKYKADVRSTHGAFHPFAENASTMFGRLGSACRFYDVPFWSESATGITANQEVERIFEALSQGAKGHFDWTSNALKNRDVYLRYGKYLKIGKPLVDVAMFYPAVAQRLRPNEGYANLFAQACTYVRDIANFDIVDDRMVLDGCLDNYRVLVLWEGAMADQTTLDKIKAWVNGGGVLLAYDFGKVTNFEGEAPWYSDESEVFGYIQHLNPAQIRERYVGAIPAQYLIPVADSNTPAAADYLGDGGDGWYQPEIVDGISRRATRASASLLLPVNPAQEYTLIVRAYIPQAAVGKKRVVKVNDQEVGIMDAVGDITYRFVLPNGILNGQAMARLTFSSETYSVPGDPRQIGAHIQYVQLVQRGVEENPRSPLPPGSIRRELDFGKLKTDWARKLGKGLTIYFPANKRLLKGYIEVVRRAIYHLSDIEEGRTDALPVDTALDGVYATLFTDQILFYNSRDRAVTKTVRFDADQIRPWKSRIAFPRETSWTVTVPPHGIEAIRFGQPSDELLFECEEFLQLNGLKPFNGPECSPGVGKTCVTLPRGSEISTAIQIETPGSYAVYVRCTHAGRLESPEMLVDDVPVRGGGGRAGQTVFIGSVNLSRGKHTLVLRARPDRDLRADFVALTNDPTVAGYDFLLRRPAFEAAPAPKPAAQ